MNESQFCQGSVFRAEVYHYHCKRGFGLNVQLKKVKKFSCEGCRHCAHEYETFGEVGSKFSPPIIGIETVEHRKLYHLKVVNERKDWETGIVDDYDVELRELTEEQIKEYCIRKDSRN